MSNGPSSLDELNADWLPGATAFVGISMGSMVIRWGPYPPADAGKIMARLTEGDPDNKIPFFVGLQCDPMENIADVILGMGWMPREQFEAEMAKAEVSPELAEQTVETIQPDDQP